MTLYNQGAVVLVPFPFTDLNHTKKRPAVVVSASWYNRSRTTVILVAVSSVIPPKLGPDMVKIYGAEIRRSGLDRTSVVITGKIFTIDNTTIIKTLGHLSRSTTSQVIDGVRHVIDHTFVLPSS